jgi:hypothetical protein
MGECLRRKVLKRAFFDKGTKELIEKSIDRAWFEGKESGFDIAYNSSLSNGGLYHITIVNGDENSCPWENYKGVSYILDAHSHPGKSPTERTIMSLKDLNNAIRKTNVTADRLKKSYEAYQRSVAQGYPSKEAEGWHHCALTFPVHLIIQPFSDRFSELYLTQIVQYVDKHAPKDDGVTDEIVFEYMNEMERQGKIKRHWIDYDRRKGRYEGIIEAINSFASTEVDFSVDYRPYRMIEDMFPGRYL